MSGGDRAAIGQLLVVSYESLTRRLARRLGSVDNAQEALHDAYLRLEKAAVIGPVRSPQDYLFRIALNAAADRRRSQSRLLSAVDIDELFSLADDAPGPARIVEARSELAALSQAMAALPERRRLIFKAVLLEEVPRQELAKRFGVTQRTVDYEVKRALEFGAQCLKNLRDGFDKSQCESSKKS